MRISCPRTPFQNCIVKRQNISIVKIGPSLMVPRSLPLKFWDTNFRITIHLLNHLPTKTLDHYNAYFLLYKKECLIIIYLEPIVGYVILNFVHLITTRLNLVPHLGCFLVIISAINDMCYEPLSQKTQISTHVVCHECFPFSSCILLFVTVIFFLLVQTFLLHMSVMFIFFHLRVIEKYILIACKA